MVNNGYADLKKAQSEVAAFASQRLLGNKAFMKKLITTDPTTAEKLIGKIREMRENFKVRKDPAAKAQLEMVRKAEKLFMQGLAEAGGTIDSKGKIHLANREEDELTRENSEKMHDSEENRGENAAEDASGENKKSPERGVRWSRADGTESDADYAEYDKPITEKDIADLRAIGRKSINDFTSEDTKKAQKWAYKFYKELGVKSPFFRAWFGDWRAFDQSKITPIEVTNINVEDALANMPTGTFSNVDAGWDISVGSLGKNDTNSHSGREKISVRLLSEIRRILESAVLFDTEASVKDSSKKHNETAFMHKLYAPVTYDGKQYIAKVTVEEYGSKTTGRRFYNLRGIKIDLAGGIPDTSVSYDTMPDARPINSISDLFAFVKQYDAEFSPKPANKALLNDDGTPRVFYHGTDESFSRFDPDKQSSATGSHFYGKGFYFSSSEEDAKRYGTNIMRAYLQAENVLDLDESDWAQKLGLKGRSSRVEIERISLEDLGNDFVDIAYTTKANPQNWMWMNRVSRMRFGYDENGVRTFLENVLNQENLLPRDVKNLAEIARAKGYDAIIGNGTNIGDVGREVVVFNPEQIKSATDNIGTFDAGSRKIRYSRTASGDVVTISKGELTKLHANYAGEKTFAKKDVVEALKSVEALKVLPAARRAEIANEIWKGYNQRLHQQGFEMFTELAWHELHAEVMQETSFEMNDDAIRAMDEQIVAALHQIVASGKPSIKAKLESATSTEGYRKQAEFWREEQSKKEKRPPITAYPAP